MAALLPSMGFPLHCEDKQSVGPFPLRTYSVLISKLTDVIPGLVAIWLKKIAMPTKPLS